MTHASRFFFFFSLGLFVIGISGCNSSSPYSTPYPYGTSTNQYYSGSTGFAAVYQEVLGPSCLQCHQNFTSAQALVSQGLVVPGNPSSSQLYEMVASGQMPRSGQQLSQQQIQLIYSWIQAGATN